MSGDFRLSFDAADPADWPRALRSAAASSPVVPLPCLLALQIARELEGHRAARDMRSFAAQASALGDALAKAERVASVHMAGVSGLLAGAALGLLIGMGLR